MRETVMMWKIVLAAGFALVSSLAFADAPKTKPEDAKTKLAIELMQITHYDKTMQAMQGQVRTMMEKQFDSFAKCDAALPVIRQFSGAIGEKVSVVFGSEELKVDIASVYAEVFSEDELKEIIEFYQSPLGRKLLDRMPDLMQKSMQISQDRVKSMMPELEKLGEEYGARIHEAAEACPASASTTVKKKK
jgi:hypothetical protein